MTRPSPRPWLLALALLFAALLPTGCARPSEPSTMAQPQDERLAALVALASGHHKRADLALHQGQRAEALRELQTLVDTVERQLPPEGALREAEAYDLLFDAAGRLARMQREDGKLDEAEASARRGLRHEAEAPPTLFRGHLHQLLADVLEAKGDPRGAVEEHGAAIEIFKSILDKHKVAPGEQEAAP